MTANPSQGMSAVTEAIQFVRRVLNDLTVDYAYDFCDEAEVAAARKRIHEHGPLNYLSLANEKMRDLEAALAAPQQAEAVDDTARLDWLEANGVDDISSHNALGPPEQRWYDHDDRAAIGKDRFPTLRALIDAAREARHE